MRLQPDLRLTGGVATGGSASIAISGTPGTTATVGTPYSFTPTVTGGTAAGQVFSLHAGTLPAGLALNTATGAITGTPTGAETQAGIVLRVTDVVNATSDLAGFQIAVSAGGYTTGAVSFDGATSLLNAALAATDNGFSSCSFWIWNNSTQPAENDPVIWVVDPGGDYGNCVDLTYNDGRISLDAGASGGSPFARATSGTSFDLPPGSTVPTPLPNGSWHHVLGTASVNAADGGKIFKIFLDRVDVTNFTQDGVGPIICAFNGKPVYVGTDTFDLDGFVGYLADLWIAPGQSLLTGATISAPTIAKFIDGSGKPVSLGADGSTPTGTAPAIFLRRAPAAAASTFATNLGTGGDFAITGSLTAAPSSPSD